MYHRILIATDGSALSGRAISSGLALAELAGAQVVVLTVVPRYPMSYFEGGISIAADDVAKIEAQWAQKANEVLEKVKTRASALGVKARTVTTSSDLVAESIMAASKKHKCDLIVMASHGRRGLKRVLLGSETTYVLTHSTTPILVVK